jgi:hypothetical protein
MKLYKGIVVVACTGTAFNGSNEQPALVTCVWGKDDTRNEPQGANIMVLPDCGSPFPMSSVVVHDVRPETPRRGTDAWLAGPTAG